jgi:hypothetical protein
LERFCQEAALLDLTCNVLIVIWKAAAFGGGCWLEILREITLFYSTKVEIL